MIWQYRRQDRPQNRRSHDREPPQTLLADKIIRSMLDPLLLLDSRLHVHTANPALYEAFQLTPEQTLNQPINEVGGGLWNIHPLQDLLEDVRDRDETFQDYEFSHEFKSIGRRAMLLNACKLPASQDGEELILLAMKDITRRKEAEEELRREEQKLRMIFENALDFAIIMMDLEGHVTAWNPGAERLLGYEESEILGQDGRIIFTQEDRDQGKADQELNKALQENRAQNERWHVRKDGSRFWGSGLVVPLYGDDEVRGLMKIMRDMTAQHQLYQERKVRTQELEQHVAEAVAEVEKRAHDLEMLNRHLHQTEQRERRRLADVLHDDLQQILVALSMRLQMAEASPSPQAMLQEARNLAEQAIHQSRSLSHELSPTVLRDRGFIAALQWLGENFQARHELPIQVNADSALDALVPTDVAETLFQMVRELLFNVVKHADATQAWVAADQLGETGLRLSVEDNGIGCDPKMMAGSENSSGHGLQSIHERLRIWGGTFKGEPRPKGGCRVILEIPRLPDGT